MWIAKLKERKFEEAYELMGELSQSNFDKIQERAFLEEDMVYYEFLNFIATNFEDSAKVHYRCSELLCSALNLFPGSYSLGYDHAMLAVEKAPEDYSLLEHILLYYEIPDRLLSRENAIKIASKIRLKYPDNQAAKQVLSVK